MMKTITYRKSYILASIAVFASLYMIALKFIKGIPVYGFSGAKIKLAIALSPVYGLILGPLLAPLSILIGTLMAMFLMPSRYNVFSIATMFCAPLSALVSSLVLDKRKILNLPAWTYTLLIYISLFIAWFTTDVGRKAFLFTIPYILAMVLIIISTITRRCRWYINHRKPFTLLYILTSSTSGILADHFLGSLEAIIIFRYIFGHVGPDELAKIYLIAMPLAATERFFMILVAFILELHLYLILKYSGYLMTEVI